jgi:hypothetical protein
VLCDHMMAPLLGGSHTSEAAAKTSKALYSEPLLRLDLNSSRRSIRVLDLLPGPRAAPIRARLRVVSLDDYPCPYYEALSYTWGSTGSTALVTINNHPLNITTNAFAALESLRTRRATRTIWIDSICIDQENDDEKNFQLPLMGDVYRSAAAVNVWLGRTKEHHEPSFRVGNLFNPELWSRTWREVRGDIKAQTIGPDDFINAPDINRQARQLAISNIRSDLQLFWYSLRSSHLALASAIETNDPWHQRLWIVQEYLLAKRLQFGFGYHWVSCDISHLLKWAKDDSYKAASFKGALGWDFEAVRLNLSWTAGERYTSLGGLQSILRTQQCYRPQGMIYGMLGLIDPYEAALITKNNKMDPWEVFAQGTYAAIRGETTFHVLDMVDLRATRDENGRPSNSQAWVEAHGKLSERLPSWSIDFARFPKRGSWKQGAWSGVDLARRREQLSRRCTLSKTTGKLCIKAVPFDRIIAQFPVETPSDEMNLEEDDIVYKLLFSVISPTLRITLMAKELVAAGNAHRNMPLLAARLLPPPQISADDLSEILGDSVMFSRRTHYFLSIAMPAAANMTMEISGPSGEVDQVLHYRVTGGNIAEPKHDPTVNAIKAACLLWASLVDTPVDMQRSGQVWVNVDDTGSFVHSCSKLLENATATAGGLAFFGTLMGGLVGIAPLGINEGDLIVRAPDEESFLVLRQRQSGVHDGDGDDVAWQFVGRALIFSMHTSDSWDRDELRNIGSFDEAPTFNLY